MINRRLSTGNWLTALWHGVENNHLIFDVKKIKEMIVDFSKSRNRPNSISIIGEEVEIVNNYRYLGVYLDNRLNRKYKILRQFRRMDRAQCTS